MTKTRKNIEALLQVCIGFILYAVLSKIMHWPNGELILLISSTCFLLIYPVYFWLKETKKKIDFVKLALALLWGLATIFSTLDLPYSNILSYLAFGAFIVWFFMNGLKKENRVSSVLFILSAFSIFLGSIFKLMHWQGAAILLITGIVLGSIWAIIGFLKKSDEKEKDEIDNIGKS